MLIVTNLRASVHGLTSLFISHQDFPWPNRDTLVEHTLNTLVYGLAPRPTD